MKGTDKTTGMVDFREYLQIEDYLLDEDEDILDEYVEDTGRLEYNESPFAPIEIGDEYVLYLFASEQNFCTPQMNSMDKYFYKTWEVCIEKFHQQYGYVICTAEIMNEIGFEKFEPMDHYVAYAEVETVQEIFDCLLNKLYIPEV